MKKIPNSLFVGLLVVFFSLPSLSAQVPSQIQVLNTPITITPGGQAAIQEKMSSLTRNQTYYNRYLERCLSHFPIIERELQAVGVPADFKFLALQESALDGSAESKSQAVGYWQFKAPTAEEYLLKIDGTVDERMNIVSSTRAAGNYFKKSYHYLNNWIYSLLSYYTGLTGAKNHIAENGLTNNVVVDENTHYYIVHFLAHYLAYKNTYESQKNRSPVYLVEYAGGIQNSMDEIAQFVVQMVPDAPMQPGQYAALLKEYNPWLKTDRIPQGQSYCYSVILPLQTEMKDYVIPNLREFACGGLARGGNNTAFYNDTLQNMYPFILKPEGLIDNRKFREVVVNGVKGVEIKKGVKLKRVAQKLGVSEADIRSFNDNFVPDKLDPGDYYYLEERPDTIPLSYHVLQEGQTLGQIAHRYGIKLEKLKAYNDITDDFQPSPGLKIFFNPE